jgi:hypothetical protein
MRFLHRVFATFTTLRGLRRLHEVATKALARTNPTAKSGFLAVPLVKVGHHLSLTKFIPTGGVVQMDTEALLNHRFMPNKLADRRAQGWVRKPGQGWVYDPEYKPAHAVKPVSREPAQQVVEVRGGGSKFQPGVSGNPAGRPKGSKNRNSNQLKQRLMENVEGILDAMVEQALAGDAQAAALVVNRVLPTLRPQTELVQFTLHVDQPISKQVEDVLLAISRGEIASDVGKKIIEAIQSLANVRAVEDLSKRIEALEAMR